jgi:hypothetical protein
MTQAVRVRLRFTATFGEPVRLSKLAEFKPQFQRRGVYFLCEGKPPSGAFDPYSRRVIYIGKAIGETIFSRCQKHLWALRDARLSSGTPRTRPGRNFKAYRAAVAGAHDKLYVVPAFMNERHPYLISCAEEYFLHQYAEANGASPKANTK